MIVAKAIAMVRWYAFDAEDVELHGDTAFIGDNGVGKSSILDAVQLLLTGGNRRFFRPNARADDNTHRTGRRTVRDYCLGKMGNAQGAVPLRGGGPSYIVMTVFNEERRQPLSFGIALYADPEQSDATIDGLFIAPGRALESTDFLIGQERGAAAAPWAEVKRRLEHEIPGFRSFRDQHNAFVKALLQNTRGRGAVAESEQWLRALRLGAQFRGVEDPDQFVRDHLLPDDPLDLPTLRGCAPLFRPAANDPRSGGEGAAASGRANRFRRLFQEGIRIAAWFRAGGHGAPGRGAAPGRNR
jgi:hypothetical protein